MLLLLQEGTRNSRSLIAGPALPGGTPAYICQECVELCSSIFQHRKVFGGEQRVPARDQGSEQKIDQ